MSKFFIYSSNTSRFSLDLTPHTFKLQILTWEFGLALFHKLFFLLLVLDPIGWEWVVVGIEWNWGGWGLAVRGRRGIGGGRMGCGSCGAGSGVGL